MMLQSPHSFPNSPHVLSSPTSLKEVVSHNTSAHKGSKSDEETPRAAGGVFASLSERRRDELHEAVGVGVGVEVEVGGSNCPSDRAPQVQVQEQEQGSRVSRRMRRGSESRHPIYRGVRKRQWGRWVSEIREPGKKTRIWLGTFPTPEMAACAYDVASFNLKKPYAFLNFPASVSSLPIPKSCSPKHIQAAAAEAAAAFQSKVATHAGGGGLIPSPQRQLLPPASSSSMLADCMQVSVISISSSTTQLTPSTSSFFDEDMIFDMPNVLTDMAHALMITPPFLYHASSHGDSGDYNGGQSLPSLWDH